MRRHKKITQKARHRTGRMESALKEIKSQHNQTGSQLEIYAERFAILERKLCDQIAHLENQIRAINSTMPNPDSLINLEEGYAVNLEELERKWEEKYSLLDAREKQLQKLEKTISEELEGLRTEFQERNLLWAARIQQVGKLAKNQPLQKRRGIRFVSFLADIGKKQ